MIRSFLKQYGGLHSLTGKVDALDYQQISIDSRTVQAGEVFLALKGENFDGHAYIPGALEKNAAAIVAEKKWFEQSGAAQQSYPCPFIVVEDSLDFLQQLGAWHRRRFSMPVIGLTGSNGKTTTREMIAAILAARFKVFRSSGNKNNHIGLPLMLLKLTADMEIAVIEMGSNHPGEIALLTDLTGPTASLVTNIGKGHLGYFGNLEAVYREKTALFEGPDKSAPIFLNVEDRYLREYPQTDRQVIKVGYSRKNNVWGRVEALDNYGRVTFSLNGAVSIRLKVPGTHQFSNALLAAAVGLHFGIDEVSVRQALEYFSPADKRMEISEKNGIIFVNDAYNANPDSMRAAVNYLATIKDGRGKRILILGDMLELGEFAEDEHRQLGEFIAGKRIDYIFLYGPESRFIHEGIERRSKNYNRAFWYKTHGEIAAHLKQIVTSHDVVLLKGSRGMAMEKVFEEL